MIQTMTVQDYWASKGLPRFGLGIDHSTLSPNGQVSKRARDAEHAKLRAVCAAIAKATREYEDKVRAGEIADPTGRTERALAEAETKRVQTLKLQAANRIEMLRRVGVGKRGLRPKYARIIAEIESELAAALAV